MSDRGRAFIIIGAVVVVGLVLSARFLAGFYVDYLWYQSVGRTDVFWGVVGSKASMFGMFGITFIALAVLNLIIADRLAPTAFSANTHPVVERFHEFFGNRLRLLRFGIAIGFGLLFAGPAVSRWQDWVMFRNSKSFGINDAQFGNDVGFYLFKLPFVTFVLDWLFLAVAFITILVVATHVLSGGIVVQPPRPKVRRATKAHVAVLLAVLAVLKAGDYWLTRYELTNANRGSFTGPNYTVVNAQLPAVLLLALIALLTAGLFLSTLKTDKWRPAVMASALWAVVALVGGVIYPAVIQSLVVNPNKKDKEATYIAYNIEATRQALGLEDVEVKPVSFEKVTSTQAGDNVAALRDVRLLKPDEKMETRFRTDVGQPGMTIADLDPDRYEVDGRPQQVIVGARELDLAQVGNKSWQGTHLINTHGCGVAMAPAAQIQSDGKPVYSTIAEITRPELYFSPTLSGYAVLRTSVTEQSCEGQPDAGPYEGTAGVQLNGGLRRLAFALSEFDYNLIGSSAITEQSRFVDVRDVRDRVSKVAPFLSLDNDPYPVVIDGRVLWVIDAYTTSSRYPYGQFADQTQLNLGSGLDHAFNYVRNSVKATVDAYDGSITLYTVDQNDPVLQVWSSAFPDLFVPYANMPAALVEHLRYPEELFRVQTAAYSKYRLDANDFFDRRGAWSVALAPPGQPGDAALSTGGADTTSGAAAPTDFAGESDAARFVPYYTMFHADGDGTATFELFRPFQPFSTTDQRKELIAYMTASSDPASYGKLVAYEFPLDQLPEGPNTIGAAMATDPKVSEAITLLGQKGSGVAFGDLQMVPVAGGVVWIAPLYVESDTAGQPLLRRMIVNYEGKVAIDTSLDRALRQVFPGFSADVGEVAGTTPTEPDPGTGTGTDNPDATAQELLQQAEDLFAAADAALEAKDLATYASKVAEARALVQQALGLLG